tara:strand:+ start:107 stop:565 length:459 start_codon:yes stop_codon:yes gene_type:complete
VNYGDVIRRENSDGTVRDISRKDMIDLIYQQFQVDSKMIGEAADAAGVRYPDEPIQYYFLASCIQEGEYVKDVGWTEADNYFDDVRERADGAVPHQTYVVWRLWVEFGYEDDAYEEMGIEPTLGNLVNVAQVQLMSYAENIIFKFGGINEMG